MQNPLLLHFISKKKKKQKAEQNVKIMKKKKQTKIFDLLPSLSRFSEFENLQFLFL